VWQVKTGEPKLRCPSPDEGALLGLAFTPDGKFLLAPADDAAIYAWKIDGGE
jgi:hypothetical protein